MGAQPDQNRVGADAVRRVRDLLTGERFDVASEAGPYHVITHLVLPRMTALASHDTLDDREAETLWRMVEYVRQKWPSYTSLYRSRRNRSADDAAIADKLLYFL